MLNISVAIGKQKGAAGKWYKEKDTEIFQHFFLEPIPNIDVCDRS